MLFLLRTGAGQCFWLIGDRLRLLSGAFLLRSVSLLLRAYCFMRGRKRSRFFSGPVDIYAGGMNAYLSPSALVVASIRCSVAGSCAWFLFDHIPLSSLVVTVQ